MEIIKKVELNEEIRDREVRLLGEDGEALGIVDTRDALRMAEEKNRDLVKIAPGAKPPAPVASRSGSARKTAVRKCRSKVFRPSALIDAVIV